MERPEGKYAWTVKVGEKGQFVIPKEAREIFNILVSMILFNTFIEFFMINKAHYLGENRIFDWHNFFKIAKNFIISKNIVPILNLYHNYFHHTKCFLDYRNIF